MRIVADKWTKCAILLRHSGVAKHMPSMRRFNRLNLERMLNQHPFIVAKPLVGTGGKRVVKIQKMPGGSYLYQYRGNKLKARSSKQLVSE